MPAGMSRSEGPYGEFLGYYGAREAESGVPPHRNHPAARRAVPDRDDRRARHGRTDTAVLGAVRTEVDDLAGAGNRGARAGGGLRDHIERRQFQCADRAAPAGAGRGTQCDCGLHEHAGQREKCLRGRSRHRHHLGRADGLGDGDAVPARPRPDHHVRHAHATARSLAHQRTGGFQGGFRSHLAVRYRQPPGNPVPAPPRFEGGASLRSQPRSPTGRNISKS